MGTIDTLLRVKADASQAVRGLQPLQSSLQETAADARKTETALDELSGQHTISVNDQAIESARLEVERLRNMMREQLRLDPTADTRDAQRKISQLQRSIKTLDQQDAVVDVSVNAEVSGLLAAQQAIAGLQSGLVGGGGGGLIGSMGAARAGMTAVGASGAAAATGVGAFALAGGLAAKGMWDLGQAAADVQTQVTQLDALTDGLGVETFEQLNEFAAQTPFALDEVTNATKRLVAAGVGLNEIPQQLEDIGNVAAVSPASLEQIATIFSQMESKGKLTFEETQQLAEAGIPVWRTLAENLGLTVAEVQKLATEGKLGADAIDLLRVALGQQFPTAMVDMSQDFNGQMSTLNDTIHMMGADLGTLFLPMMQEFVGQMQSLANFTSGAVDWLTKMDNKLRDMTGNTTGLVDALAVIPGLSGLQSLSGSQEDAAKATADHKAEVDALTASVKAEMTAAADAQAVLQEQADLMDRLETRVSDTADAYRDLVDNFEAFNGAVIDSRSHVFDYQAAVDGLAESLVKSGSFAPDAEEGRTNWDNLVALAESASERVEDTWRTKGKGAAVALQASFRQSMHQMLVDAGVSSDQAWHLVDQVLKPPHKINVEIGEINDAKLRKKLAEFRLQRAQIDTEVVVPVGAPASVADAMQKNIQDKLKPINAKIRGVLDKLKPETDKLDDAANPDGRPRKAEIDAKVDPRSIAEANADLDGVIKLRRTAHIDVVYDYPPFVLPGGPTAGPTAGPSAAPSVLATAGARMLAAPTATAGPWSTLGIPVAGGQGGSGPRVERLAPKATPVAVYLDGVEIAHRIEARRAMAATESVRRSA